MVDNRINCSDCIVNIMNRVMCSDGRLRADRRTSYVGVDDDL